MDAPANWMGELERPTAQFFRVFAQRCQEPDGPRGAVREAVLKLTPAVDWPAYLPHVPHGLLGLQAVFQLRPRVAPASFLRMLATQLHAFAHEARCAPGTGLGALGIGSGHWGNLRMALESHRSAIAWGEALGVAEPAAEDFRRLEHWAESDMANVGHKSVLARMLGDLAAELGDPAAARVLLALVAWLCASEPFDRFWHDRAAHRLHGAPKGDLPGQPTKGGPGTAAGIPWGPAQAPAELHAAGAREICDSGLVDLLDGFAGRVRATAGTGDLLAMLSLAAAEKQLDARRDLEGKTAWNFTQLAALARRAAQAGQGIPESWVQAAALVNLFPTGEAEDRPQPQAPRVPPVDPLVGLLDAILDGEPLQAMFLARAALEQGQPEAILAVLAEAASGNDPAFNHSQQLLAVAAGADLLPQVPAPVQEALLLALAKFLANSQGSSDLGRLADAALKMA